MEYPAVACYRTVGIQARNPRIYQASQNNDSVLVHQLQRLLISSWSAKCLAVRRVTQDNQGKKTAGIDGIKSMSPQQRMSLVQILRVDLKTRPVRRVWIPKPNAPAEKRGLGIPTLFNRAVEPMKRTQKRQNLRVLPSRTAIHEIIVPISNNGHNYIFLGNASPKRMAPARLIRLVSI
jgi:retron-type reverse transcriptase